MHRRNLFVWLLVTVLTLLAAGVSLPAAAQPIPAAANKYRADLVRAAHSQWGLNAPVAVLAAQVHQESGWNPNAVSHVGAAGLAQFMPATATWWCETMGQARSACLPTNPTWALRALVGYDRWLYERTPQRFSDFDRMWVALRGYNGGLGHWQAESRQAGPAPTRAAVDARCGSARRHVSHCRENLDYPQRILMVLAPRYAAWGPTLELTP